MKLRQKIKQRHMWFSLWQHELSPINQTKFDTSQGQRTINTVVLAEQRRLCYQFVIVKIKAGNALCFWNKLK